MGGYGVQTTSKRHPVGNLQQPTGIFQAGRLSSYGRGLLRWSAAPRSLPGKLVPAGNHVAFGPVSGDPLKGSSRSAPWCTNAGRATELLQAHEIHRYFSLILRVAVGRAPLYGAPVIYRNP